MMPDSFLTHSLRFHPRGPAVTRILSAALRAVEPGMAVRNHLQKNGNLLSIAGQRYNLRKYENVYVLGLGKASLAMTAPLVEILGDRIHGALIITKHMATPLPVGMEVMAGDHPIPGEHSLLAGQKAIRLLANTGKRDLVLFLISGGGSALFTAPQDGMTLEDMQSLTSALLACGARIDEINTLRRHLDRLKGGGLAGLAYPARVISLILSDVVGDPLESIASGPTAGDPTTRQDAIKILDKYLLLDTIPHSILTTLHSMPETLKPGDGLFDYVQNVIVGSSRQAAQAALEQARQEGFHTFLLQTDLQGEARNVATELCDVLKQAHQKGTPVRRPCCIVAGGETTVTVRGKGVGGRNQELALAAASRVSEIPSAMLVSLATDGEDGSTDAAGAVVTVESVARACQLGYNPLEFLERNDSYKFFQPLGDLLQPGPTGTNVNDLMFLFLF